MRRFPWVTTCQCSTVALRPIYYTGIRHKDSSLHNEHELRHTIIGPLHCAPINASADRFSKFFQWRIPKEIVYDLSQGLLSHLSCVVTVPCEIRKLKTTSIGLKLNQVLATSISSMIASSQTCVSLWYLHQWLLQLNHPWHCPLLQFTDVIAAAALFCRSCNHQDSDQKYQAATYLTRWITSSYMHMKSISVWFLGDRL